MVLIKSSLITPALATEVCAQVYTAPSVVTAAPNGRPWWPFSESFGSELQKVEVAGFRTVQGSKFRVPKGPGLRDLDPPPGVHASLGSDSRAMVVPDSARHETPQREDPVGDAKRRHR